MFTRARILALLMALTLVAICLPGFGAGEGDAAATAPAKVVGFFEKHYVLTELIVVPIFAVLLAGGMASNTSTERIRTEHWSFWNKPLGISYTHIQVPKQPSSPQEIKTTLKILAVIYVILRFTCLFSFFNALYQFIGAIIDIPFS